MDKPLQKAIDVIINISQPDKIILFGSRARDAFFADSDYDLLILKDNIEKKRKLAQEIYRNFTDIGAPIDIIISDIKQYEKFKNNPYKIYYYAYKEGKIVYEKL